MGMKPESTLVPITCSSKGTRIIEALDRIACDFDIQIVRDDMVFDDEHMVIDLSAILKLVTQVAKNQPVYTYEYNCEHLFGGNPDQLTLF